MKFDLEEMRADFEAQVKKVSSPEDIEKLKVLFLGRKNGRLTGILKSLKDLPAEERKKTGAAANRLRSFIEEKLAAAALEISRSEKKSFDFTLPGAPVKRGHLHPLTLVSREIGTIFSQLGFQHRQGPEIETEYYNFDALNQPPEHPARDLHDTFYLAPGVLLRSHTSPVQVRAMEKEEPPLRIITIGRCYRRDAVDATHSPVFHQCEGLMVEKGTDFSHLKGVLTLFLENIFPFELRTRFNPSFFPFTEPSAEVGISCPVCREKGCSACGKSGFLEIMGCGMVHPEVLKNVGYDPEQFTGFAFGMGVERIAMIKYGIRDIRLFYENDPRFRIQF